MEDVYADVFGKTIAGNENLSVADLSMQRLYVDLLQSGVADMKQAPNVHNLHADSVQTDLSAYPLRSAGAHQWCGSHACFPTTDGQTDNAATAFLNFGNGYGEPEPLWGTTVNRTSEFQLFYAQKLHRLLLSCIPKVGSPDLKAHYMLLEKRLKSYLK